MYVSISQELMRQHREEIMHGVRAAREAGTALEPQRNVSSGAGSGVGARAVRGAP